MRGQGFSENTIGRRFRTLRLYIMSLLRERCQVGTLPFQVL
ncbi:MULTISPECIES: hypothetical protein [Alistipes]|uniref:Uncharacterized protein n=1 Tax=Alistipes ihumii AP11 TaxID=1211813 RepID=A0ABY5UZS4_9BACT|nr:hypothetical protein [Alistipes ihumii]UWN57463.1 hypothetical protein NQ491_01425 [Alistipes ihumii AP11]